MMHTSEEELIELILESEKEMISEEKIFWNLIKISPQIWKNYYFGKEGSDFWVIGILGNQVLWYNDIEDGFNTSKYSKIGTIDEYWCDQDELHFTIRKLLKGGEIIRRGVPAPFTIIPPK